jgi:hypothetical protein
VVVHSYRMPVLGRWRQEDLEFEASLRYISKTLSQKKTG